MNQQRHFHREESLPGLDRRPNRVVARNASLDGGSAHSELQAPLGHKEPLIVDACPSPRLLKAVQGWTKAAVAVGAGATAGGGGLFVLGKGALVMAAGVAALAGAVASLAWALGGLAVAGVLLLGLTGARR